MAVSTNQNMSNTSIGEYVPFHQAGRDNPSGIVGTLMANAEATGDATGGEVSITLRMRREEFGFPLLWVPTKIGVRDNLAAAEEVSMFYVASGNRRLNDNFFEVQLAVRQGVTNAAILSNPSIAIEGLGPGQGDVFGATWSTNTDTKTYHLHMFGAVFDLQMLARMGRVEAFLAGLR